MTSSAIEATETWNVRGRTCMVTGASGGMGRELAASLARRGARVVMVCRDPDRGRAARDAIIEVTGSSAVELLLADLSDQTAIRRMVAEFLDRHDHLHVLINNAGAHVMRRELSIDGIEMNLAVNHLSAFVLTNLLLPTLKSSAPARIVDVASRAMTKSIDLDNLNWEHDFAPWPAYGQAKLAMVLCSYRLARQLAGTGVVVNAVHPGLTATDIVDDIASPRLRAILPVVKAFLLSPERGARAALRLATSAELTGVTGAYFKRGRRRRSVGVSYFLDLQDKTWQASTDFVVAGQGEERIVADPKSEPVADSDVPEAAKWNTWVINQFRANGGNVPGQEGRQLLLLHHIGAKTAQERTTPLLYRTDAQGRPVVFAAFAGAPHHPCWFQNVRAHPEVSYEIGTEFKRATARVSAGEEREHLWALQKTDNPGFAQFEDLAAPREIPVIVLEPPGP
jgi:deazaflavin-dependent oxidoreductase (nitroreductase family)